jgi:hypothetical protein
VEVKKAFFLARMHKRKVLGSTELWKHAVSKKALFEQGCKSMQAEDICEWLALSKQMLDQEKLVKEMAATVRSGNQHNLQDLLKTAD